MKSLMILTVALMTTAAHAQLTGQAGNNSNATAAVQGAGSNASAATASNVSAEMTSKLDSKHAQVGDPVTAKTTASATLADGTKLPKGTKLVGQVTEVHARDKADNASHLAFRLDRAVLRDGREIPIHATLASLRPAAAMAATSANDDFSAGGLESSGGGGVMASSGSGRGRAGGLVGGTARTTGGLVQSGVGTVGGATRTVGSAGDALVGGTTATARNATGGLNGGLNGNLNSGGGLQLYHQPVAGLPGVTMSSSMNGGNAGSLDGMGRNISVDSGSQMSLAVSATN